MRIAVRADASRQIGSGHVMRTLALAQRLRAGGDSVEFVCADLPGNLCARIEAAGFAAHRLAAEAAAAGWERDLEATRSALGRPADWLVVDHYALDARWERGMRAGGTRILAIDDLAREHDCDVLVDQNLHADAQRRYPGPKPPKWERLLGPGYALLREEFVEARAARRERDGGVRRLLVSFGGQDADDETSKALAALDAVPGRRFGIDVLATRGHPNLEALRLRCARMADCRLHVDAEAIAALLVGADLAIGAAGVSLWERCSTGLPSVLVAVAENQVPSSEAMARTGHAVYLGRSAAVDAAALAAALVPLLADPARLRDMATACAALVDGRGTRRVGTRLQACALTLRRAIADDCERIHAWRNAEVNRRHAADPAEISLDHHRRWYKERMDDPACDLLLAERDAEPIGVLRYDIAGDEARVSVYLVPGAHGRGLGRMLLVRGTRWLAAARPAVGRITAEILPQNAASLRAFADAGYAPRGDRHALDLH